MNGVEIQYLLGLYFLVTSMSLGEGKFKFDIVKGVAAAVLIISAILGVTLIS